MRYEERAALSQNAMGRQLFELMARKRTNLSVAADVATVDDMLDMADKVGPHICVLKTHVDVFDQWTEEHAKKLQALAEKHGELVCDIRQSCILLKVAQELNQCPHTLSMCGLLLTPCHMNSC